MIHISWLPYWNPIIDYASSRLRCLYHHQNLNKYHNTEFTSSIINQNKIIEDLAAKNNILIVAQKINQETLQILINFKKNKENILIYDIVDNYYTDPKVKQIFSICDYVIVANEAQAKLVSSHINKKIFVLADCIDYEDHLDTTILPVNKNIVWFGNNSSLPNIRPLLQNLIPNHTVNIISSNYYKNLIPGTNHFLWSYDNFISNLKLNNVSFLTHDLNQQQKSNNKLLTSIANGIPVLSYHSKSYNEILKKFNLNYAIIDKRQDLVRALNILSTDSGKQEYLKDIQPYILENYNSKVITSKLVDIIKEIISHHPKPTISIKPVHQIPKSLQDQKKIVLYTANFGDYDNFNEIKQTHHHLDYIYFTDKNIKSNTWKIKVVNDSDYNSHMTAKMYKILPHRFFPDYDISIWIDASAKNIYSSFSLLLEYLKQYNFIITKHPSRDCVYEEARVCIQNNKDIPDKIIKQIERYKQEDYPFKNKLYQCGFLIRKHHEIIEFSEAWWEEILNNSCRDQISFPYIYNKYKNLIKLQALETKECLKHFSWYRHKGAQLIKPKIFQRRV
jgi:hypothetical protein